MGKPARPRPAPHGAGDGDPAPSRGSVPVIWFARRALQACFRAWLSFVVLRGTGHTAFWGTLNTNVVLSTVGIGVHFGHEVMLQENLLVPQGPWGTVFFVCVPHTGPGGLW